MLTRHRRAPNTWWTHRRANRPTNRHERATTPRSAPRSDSVIGNRPHPLPHPLCFPEDDGPDAQPDPRLVAVDAACRSTDLGVGVHCIGLVIVFVLMKRPKPDRPATWAECIAGAVGVFAMMTLAYAVIPHEWITFSDKYLQWDTTQFVVRSGQDVFGLGSSTSVQHRQAGRPRHHRRRSSTCVVFGLNLCLFVDVAEARRGEAEPAPPTRREDVALRPPAAAQAPTPSSPPTVGCRARTVVTPDGPHRRQPADARLRHRLRAAGGRPLLPHRVGEAEAVPPHRPGRVHPLRGLRRHLPVEVHPHGLGERDQRRGQHRAARRGPA